MTEPLISVIMSVRDSEKTIVPALRSIFQQTYTNWELIVCDDASSDKTAVLLHEAAAAHDSGKIILIRNNSRRKLAYSLNRCLAVARGEFVARMDADDLSEPFRFERQMEFLKMNPEVDLVGSAMRRFSAGCLGSLIMPAAKAPDRWTMAKSSRAPFCHATILARRAAFDAVGNYTVSWRTERGQDTDLWFKFFAAGLTGRNLDEPLYLVREDGESIRRRTPRARFGSYVTRVKGSIMLGHPPRAYVMHTVNLLKIFVPYELFDWHRRRSQTRAGTGL